MRTRVVMLMSWLWLAYVLSGAGAAWQIPAAQAAATARIDTPAGGASIIGRVEVRGRASNDDPSRFSFFRLHYGAGESPTTFRPIGNPGEHPVEDGLLGVWDTAPLIAGPYTLQLTVYDTQGGTTTARAVVNVLPAPTPTRRTNENVVVVPPPEQTPTADDAAGPTPTPIPELPQLDPQIQQIDVPPRDPAAPVQPADSQVTNPGFRPIQIDPGSQPQALPPPAAPLDSAPIPTIDTGPPGGQPGLPPIDPVGPPPAPVVQPYEPPPAPTPIPLPTPDGLQPAFGLPFQP